MLPMQFTTLASHLVSNLKHTRIFNIFQKSSLHTILHFCYNSLYITRVKLKSYFRTTFPKNHRKVDNMRFKYSLHATGKKQYFAILVHRTTSITLHQYTEALLRTERNSHPQYFLKRSYVPCNNTSKWPLFKMNASGSAAICGLTGVLGHKDAVLQHTQDNVVTELRKQH